ncbi:hypothetical protein FA13DRAFT_1725858 [Coprinellus micaceus]|uniref:Zn(2)-C6 fungal-type domain-containing protein n=1 Tax=Coprinellus micaceus TaxID=71717 RepID=A0A4Y7TVK0_COPMI|nr:hypothetical protein FA13DRAFT_1725858 [Coprinellus micaceus]
MPAASDIPGATRKRRNDNDAQGSTVGEADPPTEGSGHRKKRRNRTTQSCLNCHTSKRMCDRRRPACSRCTQLGLTGLCVYEVDDPNQRADLQDETARLITRVAELEGVIREMKNKPNPRWAQGQSGGHLADVAPEMWIHRSHHRVQSDMSYSRSSRSSSPTSSGPMSEAGSNHGGSPYVQAVNHYPSPSSVQGSNVYPHTPVESLPHAQPPNFSHSTQSPSSSPLVSTPVDEYARQANTISSGEYDFANMLLSYQPNYSTQDEFGGSSKDSGDGYHHLAAQSDQTYCGCAEESPTYSVLLELSVRLRRAADLMSRNPTHICAGNCCSLHRQVSDLDSYLSSLLGGLTPAGHSLANDIPSALPPSNTQSGNAAYGQSYQQQAPLHSSHHVTPSNNSSVSPLIHTVQSWDLSGSRPPWDSPTRT